MLADGRPGMSSSCSAANWRSAAPGSKWSNAFSAARPPRSIPTLASATWPYRARSWTISAMPTAGSMPKSLAPARSQLGTRLKKRPADKVGRCTFCVVVRNRSAAGQHVSRDPPTRVDRFRRRVIVVAGYDDWIAVGIDAADHADMAAAVAAHHRDGADLRAGNARAVTRIGTGEVAAAGVAGALEHQVHEGAAP